MAVAAAGIMLISSTKKETPNNKTSLGNFPTATIKPALSPSPIVAASPSASIPPAVSTTPTASPSSVIKNVEIQAIIKTGKGNITLQLFDKDAPNTVKNFIQKEKSGFYNNLIFHRVENWVIQGGDPLGTGTGGSEMPTELNDKPFVVGALGVARGGNIKISNDAQFFITKTDSQFLNKQYTNFGIVTGGMDVVNKIAIGDKILGITVE